MHGACSLRTIRLDVIVLYVEQKVSPKRLTHAQMEEIRTQNKVLLIEIQRAEDVWQRKLKEKLSANSGSYDLQVSS